VGITCYNPTIEERCRKLLQMKYKQQQAKGLFDEEFRLEKLASQKDPLVKLKDRIDFELF
jgi:hypothetical protein